MLWPSKKLVVLTLQRRDRIFCAEQDGYLVLTAQPAGCFRSLSLAFGFDPVTHWCSARVGHSHLFSVVDLPPLSFKVCLVSVHLLHSARPLSDFHLAFASNLYLGGLKC